MSEKEEKFEKVEAAGKPKRASRAKKAEIEPKAKKPRTTRKKPEKKAVAEAEAVKAEDRPVAKGDFILVEMTGKIEETGEVFDTTDEAKAKEAGVQEENRAYSPQLVVVGEGWVLKGLDARLEGLKVGGEAEVAIPPQEAFGERDPNRVRIVPFRVLRSKGINPTLGAKVEVDGEVAVVRSVGAGRVQLDYNPQHAGRKIVYSVKVSRRYETDEEKARALLDRRFTGIGAEKFLVKLTKKAASIEVPEEAFFAENLQLAKRGLALDIQRFFPDMESVEFREVVKKKA